MYYGLNQGQITPNTENKYVLKLIHLVAQCSKITNTLLFLKTYIRAVPELTIWGVGRQRFCFLMHGGFH